MTSRGRIARAFWVLTLVIVLAVLAFALRGLL
ncbi:hypothetical protein SAMN05216376_11444 [Mameliella alba]|uniref:Uncharacterized protein n=1 Tax=Mameliella alba TaxID=561184 RepID=A0A0B3RYQ8_9RHOB|nr:hypothetical protein OA50_02259 [Mameliella alba]SDD93785.1 hypothetical protein SAMN05216376_11444 [Mameliella alba]